MIRLAVKPLSGFCPYCLGSVGILGNWLAVIFGTRFHGCDFSNVITPGGEEVDEVVTPG